MGRSGIVAQFNTPTKSYDLDSAIHTFLNDSRIITLVSEGDKLIKELADLIYNIPIECRMHINPALSKIFYIIYTRAFYLYNPKHFKFVRISLTDDDLVNICSKYSVAFNISDDSTKSPFYNMYREIMVKPARDINLVSLKGGTAKYVSTFPVLAFNTDKIQEERKQALFKVMAVVHPYTLISDRITETVEARIQYFDKLVSFIDRFTPDYMSSITIPSTEYFD